VLGSWSRVQAVIARSSCEAEFYSLICGADEPLQLQNILKSAGLDVEVVLHTESSAAGAVSYRIGCGCVKHLASRVRNAAAGEDREGVWA
jgi:hypothetical protein